MFCTKLACYFVEHAIKRSLYTLPMACSRYEYVKEYELDDRIVPNVWIVIRLDGKAFTKFSEAHGFEKPNDLNALNLMTSSAVVVMKEFPDIILSYGQSDEYSFVFQKHTQLYNRRAAKLLTNVTSLYSSAYIHNWKKWFSDRDLKYLPSFDGRVIFYPSDQNLKDYLSWRQADVHVNNLYNTAFWKLVQNGSTRQQAEEKLRGSFSSDKNELLFSEFGINYNDLPRVFRKGTILLRKYLSISKPPQEVVESNRKTASEKLIKKRVIVPLHEDMIKEQFWKDHPELLGKYTPPEYVPETSEKGSETYTILQEQLEQITGRVG